MNIIICVILNSGIATKLQQSSINFAVLEICIYNQKLIPVSNSKVTASKTSRCTTTVDEAMLAVIDNFPKLQK